MPTSTPHVVRPHTHTHNEITQTHTHTHGQATSDTHTRVVGEHHTHKDTQTTLYVESTQAHTMFFPKRNHKVAYTLMPKRNEIETQGAKSRKRCFPLSNGALAAAKLLA